jgi:hypothetical protein
MPKGPKTFKGELNKVLAGRGNVSPFRQMERDIDSMSSGIFSTKKRKK